MIITFYCEQNYNVTSKTNFSKRNNIIITRVTVKTTRKKTATVSPNDYIIIVIDLKIVSPPVELPSQDFFFFTKYTMQYTRANVYNVRIVQPPAILKMHNILVFIIVLERNI